MITKEKIKLFNELLKVTGIAVDHLEFVKVLQKPSFTELDEENVKTQLKDWMRTEKKFKSTPESMKRFMLEACSIFLDEKDVDFD